MKLGNKLLRSILTLGLVISSMGLIVSWPHLAENNILYVRILMLVFCISGLGILAEILFWGNYWKRITSMSEFQKRTKAFIYLFLYLIFFGFHAIWITFLFLRLPDFCFQALAILAVIFSWRNSLIGKEVFAEKRWIFSFILTLLYGGLTYLSLVLYLLFWYGVVSLLASS